MENYLIIIEKCKNNYSAYSPDINGVVATGKTKEETRKNFIDALELHLEGLKEDHLSIPKPKTDFTYISEKCTGILNVRCRKSLHQKLLNLAEKEQVSVSHLVNDALVKEFA